ncbi:alpha/beta fold hydrolase [Deinococcus sp. QL22]|uniref:alpha/beta fold hydrolase n=1 Tax=Deinococcus sp. QL22 TaxID=2939437 RepID=UPI002016F2BA|nr:alpha/beta fold hydrolase [Deinococcus sp. QL22]UQN07333.1 alpha/beta fold hydrolase [Deinococcus sp. QL22]
MSRLPPAVPPMPTFLSVSGVRTRHVALGDGPPLVLLHGIGQSLEDWHEVLAPLAERHRVYALDLIGFGLTDKPDVPYSLAGLARFVQHFLDAVGETRPATLIGNSLGGAVAQQFAVMYPERAARLVLVNSAGFGAEVTPLLRLLTVPRLGERLLRPHPRSTARVVRSIFRDSAFMTPERLQHAELVAEQPNRSRAYLSVARHLGTWRGIRPDWRDTLIRQLAARQLPTLLIWGEYDQILPAHHLRAAQNAYPHARSHLFKNTGHLPQVERAGEFSALVLGFINVPSLQETSLQENST